MCYYIKIFFIVFYFFKKFYIASKKNYIFKYCVIDFVLFISFLTSENNTNHKSTFKKINNIQPYNHIFYNFM